MGQAIPLRRYTHSANVDEPLQLETFTASGAFEASYTYHADHLGSIRYLTDSSGTIVNAYDYDSYGRPMFGVTAFDQPFAYTGREWDAATGLYHYRARAYDAEMGRFLQEDRIWFSGNDLNIYRYVKNNPINYNDPLGESAVETVINAADRAASLQSSFKPVADGIGCIFGGIGSVFEALELAEQNGDTIVDISVDLKSCGAAVIAQAAPLLSDDPLTNTGEFARNALFQIAIVKFLKGALPSKAFSSSLHPSATPAYPSTWKAGGPDLSR